MILITISVYNNYRTLLVFPAVIMANQEELLILMKDEHYNYVDAYTQKTQQNSRLTFAKNPEEGMTKKRQSFLTI